MGKRVIYFQCNYCTSGRDATAFCGLCDTACCEGCIEHDHPEPQSGVLRYRWIMMHGALRLLPPALAKQAVRDVDNLLRNARGKQLRPLLVEEIRGDV